MRLPPARIAALLALSFVVAGDAAAAIRHAAPGSNRTSGACATDTPCRLDFAVSGAAAGDTVQLAPGDYQVTYAVAAKKAIHVTGDPEQPRPRLIGDANRTVAVLDMSFGGSIRHLYAESNSAAPAINVKGGVVERVVAYSPTAAGMRAKSNTGSLTIRNSVVHTASGNPALALTDNALQGTIDVANVTAVGTGAGSAGIEQGSGAVVTIVNSVARGASNDFRANGGVLPANVSYSNFRPAASTGVTPVVGNQAGDPLFLNAADGDFQEADNSPTIDAGTVTLVAIGSVDLAGNLRVFGTAADIGAFEKGSIPAPPGTGGGSGDGDGSGNGTDPGETPGDGDPDAGAPLPPAAPPVLGRSVELGPVSGTVTVQVPGSSSAVVLDDAASVPVGSVIDATRGVVSLTSARDGSGTSQTGRFWGGAFRVVQRRSGARFTTLKLVGSMGCGANGKVAAAGRRARRLWGRDNHGRFRTRGRGGHATVRGTQWLTKDRCGGTVFRVKRGAIVVRDFAKRRRIRLEAGERYLARTR